MDLGNPSISGWPRAKKIGLRIERMEQMGWIPGFFWLQWLVATPLLVPGAFFFGARLFP
jgi:hypothetical protein